MADAVVITGRARAAPPRRLRVSPGSALGVGLITTYLSLIVLIPLAAVVDRALSEGVGAFWDAVTAPQAVAALKLTFAVSAIVAAINAVTGTLIAWVLVRDDFRGKRFVNALIDLPFALPTIVAGLTLLALYGAARARSGIDVAYTPRGGRAGAAVRHAPVRRPRGAAGADGGRPRAGGGGQVARRLADGRPSAGWCCRACARRSWRAPASRSRARSASSARSC